MTPSNDNHRMATVRIVGIRNLPSHEFARGFCLMVLASTLTFAIGLTVYGIVQGLLP